MPFEAFQPASKPAAASTQQAARKPSIKGLGAGLPGKGSAAGCSVRSSATAQADATPQPSAPTHATSSGQHPQSDSPASSAAAADQPPESATRASRSAATGGSNPARATASEATFNANPAASASPMGGLMGQLMSQMGGSGGSGGGLMDMVGRMAQSPAMQQLAEQLFSGEGAEGEPGGESSQQGGGGPDSGPNMGAIMQQMLPLVSQVRWVWLLQARWAAWWHCNFYMGAIARACPGVSSKYGVKRLEHAVVPSMPEARSSESFHLAIFSNDDNGPVLAHHIMLFDCAICWCRCWEVQHHLHRLAQLHHHQL